MNKHSRIYEDAFPDESTKVIVVWTDTERNKAVAWKALLRRCGWKGAVLITTDVEDVVVLTEGDGIAGIICEGLNDSAREEGTDRIVASPVGSKVVGHAYSVSMRGREIHEAMDEFVIGILRFIAAR